MTKYIRACLDLKGGGVDARSGAVIVQECTVCLARALSDMLERLA